MAKAGEREVDAYIAAAPKNVQPMLRQIRQAIKSAAPEPRRRSVTGCPSTLITVA